MSRPCVGGLQNVTDVLAAVCVSHGNSQARAAATPQFACAYLFAVVRSKK